MSDSIKKIVVTGGMAVWTPPPTEGDETRRARRDTTTHRVRRRLQPKFAVSRQDGGVGDGAGEKNGAGENNGAGEKKGANASKQINEVIRYVVTPEPSPVPFKNIPAAAAANAKKPEAPKTPNVQALAAAPAAAPTSAPAEGGGTTKVIIGEKKPRHVKVILTKKRARTPDAPPKLNPEKGRKVQLKTGRLRKVMKRAQTIRAKAAELPLEKVRAELVSEGIIKSSSKAPEAMLRQMYTDAKILSAKTL